MNLKEYKNFKKMFWDWFDNMHLKEKEKYWYYKEDMSETAFYFRVYSKEEN